MVRVKHWQGWDDRLGGIKQLGHDAQVVFSQIVLGNIAGEGESFDSAGHACVTVARGLSCGLLRSR